MGSIVRKYIKSTKKKPHDGGSPWIPEQGASFHIHIILFHSRKLLVDIFLI